MSDANLKRVLFICKNNSGRSQMAEAILKHLYGENFEVSSAGSHPRPINPLTIEVLQEIGIDASSQESKNLQKFQGQEFDLVVSLCGDEDEACPVFLTGKKYAHQGFKDPAGIKGDKKYQLKLFREIRDSIFLWIESEFQDDNILE
ncbi:arsenate reductase ArsC [Methanobacterium alkalithermotolerans]|uniref:Arsenate reductase ArsC n=1 Tax=Methanobacterium alkalithermotolerans TaxID=2731220 RepID=A0A8T8K469_9EURY|nr:arsenate reductase ArsC [Methanobacterium alkalithermotolerans]QUH23346.1 arsenate reductase ArsC [Methanobacterium alkalithermotolerans]RJS48906.1 MAG: low molecular weight phosphatase family protein [Methanobacterium sp.]